MALHRELQRLGSKALTFHFHALEKEMATHASVLAWRIPGTGEPGGLPSMGSLRVGHDWSDLAAAAAAAREEMRYWIKYLSFGVRPGLKSELQFLLCVMGKRRPPYRATVKTNWDNVPKCSALTPSFSSLSRLVLPVTLGFTYQSWEFRTICLLLILLTAFPLTRLQ